MGMTDKQFNSYVRLLLENLKEAKEEIESQKTMHKLIKLIESLQTTLED